MDVDRFVEPGMSLIADAAAARAAPTSLALADERVRLDWRELDRLVGAASDALLAENLPEGARAGVFAFNAAETAIAYAACLHAGVSAIPVNFHLTAEEVAYILADGGAAILFVGPETCAVGLEAAKRAGVRRVVGWRTGGEGVMSWRTWLEAAPAGQISAHRPPAPFLHYTSGTTGRPKGTETPPTMFPRAATVAELFAALRDQVAAAPQGPGLAVGPLYHTGPLGSVRQLAGGKPLVTLERFDAEAVLVAIERHRIASTVMVPTHFQRLLALPPEVRARYDISSLQWVAHTGAACPVEVKRRMIEWFGPVLMDAYGGTEAGTTNLISSEEWLRKPGSVGRTQPPFELVVVDEDGRPLPTGHAGQLYFRDTTGRGVVYHNDPDKTRAAHLEPGVFTLGDVGYVDEEGYVFITDRASDMIVSGGVNIYPAETEQVLLRHDGVADVAVIGAPDPEMGEAVKALVVPADPADPPSPQELDAFCRAHLAGFKCPRSYEFVPDLGRNAMGKINKRALRAPYWPTERTIGG